MSATSITIRQVKIISNWPTIPDLIQIRSDSLNKNH